MLIVVNRDVSEPTYTTSRITIDNEHICYGLEDAVREKFVNGRWTWKPEFKLKGKTAIPSGEYFLIIDFSNRFQRDLPHILDVPDFTGIRIHSGNTELNTEGCLLPGKGRGEGFVSYSRAAFAILLHRIKQAIEHGVKVRIRFDNQF